MSLISNLAIDVEQLANLVQKAPELYDTSSPYYTDKERKKSAWQNICTDLIDDYEDLSPAEKVDVERTVSQRWRTVRDCYVKYKRASKSDDGGKRQRKYCYSKHLKFIDRFIGRRPAKISRNQYFKDGDSSDNSSMIMVDSGDATEVLLTHPDDDDSDIKPMISNKRLKLSDLVSEIDLQHQNNYQSDANILVNYSHPNGTSSLLEDDADVAFFRSILPLVKKLEEPKILQFRLNVMNNLQELLGYSTKNEL